MSKEDKYYQPEIEELFEHLLNERFLYSKIAEDEGWKKITFEANTTSDLLKSFIEINDWSSDNGYDVNEDIYRLKLLDREDVESLGWKFSEYWIREEQGSIYLNNLYGLTVFNGSNTICIWERVQGDIEGETYFRGTIKNKSELKRLLKQIGV